MPPVNPERENTTNTPRQMTQENTPTMSKSAEDKEIYKKLPTHDRKKGQGKEIGMDGNGSSCSGT